MAQFSFGQTVPTPQPTITVENHLDPGAYRFRLVVIDNDHNPSAPTELIVRIVQTAPPPVTPTTLPPHITIIPPVVVPHPTPPIGPGPVGPIKPHL